MRCPSSEAAPNYAPRATHALHARLRGVLLIAIGVIGVLS
jgi:hypothetical protein